LKKEVRGSCPSCNEEVDWLYTTENIPYFSDILIISCLCPKCGYHFSDVQNINTNEPIRYTFTIKSEEDLSVRIVRSGTAIVTIPELGIEINPGPACEGFVSNTEGILCRIDQILDNVLIDGDDIQQKQAMSLKKRVAETKEGKGELTLIIEDPNGNSLIDSESAKKESYIPSS
jgi:zinc finger protein